MYEPRIADKITVDLSCDDCPAGERCARCQAIVDAAVADTLAAGIAPEHVNVADPLLRAGPFFVPFSLVYQQ